ncbi:putative ribonuclease H-like domain-containing protein [Tanacetum coccineum]
MNHSNFARNSRHPHQRRSFIPSAVLTRDGLISTLLDTNNNKQYHQKVLLKCDFSSTARSKSTTIMQYFHEVRMEDYYLMELILRRPIISIYSPSRSSTTRTPHRPQRPKKIVKYIWVKKGSTIGSQAVLPQTVKKNAMINPKQTWRPKGNYLDSVNRDNGSTHSRQFEYVTPLGVSKSVMTWETRTSCLILKSSKVVMAAFGNDSKGNHRKNAAYCGTEDWGMSTSKISNKLVKGNLVKEFNPSKTSKLDPHEWHVESGKHHRASCKKLKKELSENLLNAPTWTYLDPVFRHKKVQDSICLHVNFLENQENQKGKGPDWMFDLDLLTPSMNYIPVRKENYADSKEQGISCDDVEDLDDQQFIVHTAQPMHPEERTAAKEVQLSSEEQALHDELVSLMHQESLAKAHNDDQRIAFEEEKRRISIAKGKEHVNSGVADYNNMDPTIDVPSTPTLRIHKIHPQSQIIGESTAGVQTRRKLKESTSDQHQALLSFIYKQNRTNHKDQQTCLFACFLSQEEPKKVSQALADESWVEAMQEELLQFKLQEVWVLCDLQKQEVKGTKWVFLETRERTGFARIEGNQNLFGICIFHAVTSYQMDVKSGILYGTSQKKCICQTCLPGLEDQLIHTSPNKFKHFMPAIKPPRSMLKFNLLSVSQICDKKHNVLFTDKECLILSPKFKFVDEDLVILRAPRKNDVYSLDLKNIIPSGGITCLVAKATEDEAVLWHRRLGHVNFKNINKLVKGNLVRGLPSKTFKLDHSCLACRKGKQHRASCKKIESLHLNCSHFI